MFKQLYYFIIVTLTITSCCDPETVSFSEVTIHNFENTNVFINDSTQLTPYNYHSGKIYFSIENNVSDLFLEYRLDHDFEFNKNNARVKFALVSYSYDELDQRKIITLVDSFVIIDVNPRAYTLEGTITENGISNKISISNLTLSYTYDESELCVSNSF